MYFGKLLSSPYPIDIADVVPLSRLLNHQVSQMSQNMSNSAKILVTAPKRRYFLIQFYVSFQIIGQLVGGAKTGDPREKIPDTSANRTWLVSRVARAGLEPTPDTAMRDLVIKKQCS